MGRYPVHEKPQDELLKGIGDLMGVIGTSERRRKEIRDYLAEVLEEKRPSSEWLHPFDSGVTDAVFRSMKSGLEDWRKGVETELADRREAGKKRSNELRESIAESLEEFFDIFL